MLRVATDRPTRTTVRVLTLSVVLALSAGILSGCLFAPAIDGTSRQTIIKTPPATDGSIEPWPDDTAPPGEAVPSPSDGASDSGSDSGSSDGTSTEPPASRAPIGP